MSQQNDPENNFIEFVQVWGGRLHMYLEAVIMFDARNGKFTVQVGHKINEKPDKTGRRLKIITTTGTIIEIGQKKKAGPKASNRYKLTDPGGKKITATRTYLSND